MPHELPDDLRNLYSNICTRFTKEERQAYDLCLRSGTEQEFHTLCEELNCMRWAIHWLFALSSIPEQAFVAVMLHGGHVEATDLQQLMQPVVAYTCYTQSQRLQQLTVKISLELNVWLETGRPNKGTERAVHAVQDALDSPPTRFVRASRLEEADKFVAVVTELYNARPHNPKPAAVVRVRQWSDAPGVASTTRKRRARARR